MKIDLTVKYKSLKPFESETLNDFTVITGANGSGKTQLLQLVKGMFDGDKSKKDIIKIEPDFQRVQFEGIEEQESSVLNFSNYKQFISNVYRPYSMWGINTKKIITLLYRGFIEIDEGFIEGKFFKITNVNDLSHNDLIEIIDLCFQELNGEQLTLHNNYKSKDQFIIEHYNYEKSIDIIKIVEKVSNYYNKMPYELTESNFLNYSYDEIELTDVELFRINLERIFHNYINKRFLNDLNYYRKKMHNESNDSIVDSDFIKKFPPPWQLLNTYLKKFGQGFYFRDIKLSDYNIHQNFELELIHKASNNVVSFNHLSSGEKIIIGLLIKLFSTNYYNNRLMFPELIVLDEPDAHLHPEMTNLLIEVLLNTFVKELGIKVIFTTHSPSTIALCPDGSIYLLKNYPDTTLRLTSKDEALTILTKFLPSLSIDYKNHKQVFVEGEIDVVFYQTLSNKHFNKSNIRNTLYFISNSNGEGNSDQVKKVVKEIRKSGNETSYGIIDWDLNNKCNEFIFVHGEEKRYTLENYLFDPLYLIVLQMTNKANNIHKQLDLEKDFNEFSIHELDDKKLQSMSDYFFDNYYKEYTINDFDKTNLIEVLYYNGSKISIPKWFLENKGHDLEDKIRKVLGGFMIRYNSDLLLKRELIEIMSKCYPFVPQESIELIENLIEK